MQFFDRFLFFSRLLLDLIEKTGTRTELNPIGGSRNLSSFHDRLFWVEFLLEILL